MKKLLLCCGLVIGAALSFSSCAKEVEPCYECTIINASNASLNSPNTIEICNDQVTETYAGNSVTASLNGASAELYKEQIATLGYSCITK